MKDINCRLHTLEEVAALLRGEEHVSLNKKESREILASWLEELKDSRDAIEGMKLLIANRGAQVTLPAIAKPGKPLGY